MKTKYIYLLVIGCICASSTLVAQEHLSKEWAITSENDAFLLKYSDAYYSNGIFFRFSKAVNVKGQKRIHQFEIGQQLFTPLSKLASNTGQIDRPYCGYLFTRYSQLRTTARKGLLSWQISLGTLGPNSLAENLQDSYHDLFDYKRFEGWKYQVRNAIGIDAGISYAHTLANIANAIRIVPAGEAQLGSNFTGARISTFFCLGQSNDVGSGTLFNTRISKNGPVPEKKTEVFAFWAPTIRLQAYNATLQGNLFNKGTGAILAQPETLVWEQRYGICLAGNRVSTRMELIHQSKETASQRRTHSYGSVQFAYRLF